MNNNKTQHNPIYKIYKLTIHLNERRRKFKKKKEEEIS